MTPAQATTVIYKRWMERWSALQPSVPFAFDNDPRPAVATYAIVEIISLDSDQQTLGGPGNRKMERTGMISVRLVGPVAGGRVPLDLLSENVRDVFETVRIGSTVGEHGVTTHASTVAELRRDRESPNSWILAVTTPFEFYARR